MHLVKSPAFYKENSCIHNSRCEELQIQANICNTPFQICLFRAVANEKINLEETKFQSVCRLPEDEQRERILSPGYFSGIEKKRSNLQHNKKRKGMAWAKSNIQCRVQIHRQFGLHTLDFSLNHINTIIFNILGGLTCFMYNYILHMRLSLHHCAKLMRSKDLCYLNGLCLMHLNCLKGKRTDEWTVCSNLIYTYD